MNDDQYLSTNPSQNDPTTSGIGSDNHSVSDSSQDSYVDNYQPPAPIAPVEPQESASQFLDQLKGPGLDEQKDVDLPIPPTELIRESNQNFDELVSDDSGTVNSSNDDSSRDSFREDDLSTLVNDFRFEDPSDSTPAPITPTPAPITPTPAPITPAPESGFNPHASDNQPADVETNPWNQATNVTNLDDRINDSGNQSMGDQSMDETGFQNNNQNDDQSDDESLELQNIFEMLGVSDGTDEERDQFLDELQQVIWEDFLENDVSLLITTEEKSQIDEILGKSNLPDQEKQEEVMIMLEKLLPDLEEVMLEKALELKSDLFRERVLGTKEYFANDQEKQSGLDEIMSLVDQGKWRTATDQLNLLVNSSL